MSKPPATTSAAREALRAFAPKLVDLTDNVLFGDVWERKGLGKRDRSLITCATLIALNRTEQQVGHFQRRSTTASTKEEAARGDHASGILRPVGRSPCRRPRSPRKCSKEETRSEALLFQRLSPRRRSRATRSVDITDA
jgi:hypothetical protein